MIKRVFVEYTGAIASHSGKKQEWVELEAEETVKDLLLSLGYRKEHLRFIVVTVDGERASLENQLKDQTAVTLFLPAGGG